MSRRRPPLEMRVVLDRWQGQVAPVDLLSAAQRHWREAVGERVAEEAWPERERDGQLTVRCRSAVWAAELTMLAETLVGELNARLGEERQVRGLKFTAAPVGGRFPEPSA
jgi:predicted nucleic acid-binding Zn ribbon protein